MKVKYLRTYGTGTRVYLRVSFFKKYQSRTSIFLVTVPVVTNGIVLAIVLLFFFKILLVQ